MQTFTLKSGTNKGNRRIWIEGQRLIDAGLPCGTILYRYNSPTDLDFPADSIVLSTIEYERTVQRGTASTPSQTLPTTGKHKIANRKGTPILDLCGKWVTKFIGDHTHFEVTADGDHLIIRPTNA